MLFANRKRTEEESRIARETENANIAWTKADKKYQYIVGKYIRTNANYCVVFTGRLPAKLPSKFDCVKISVYRLQHAPYDYQPYYKNDFSNFKKPSSGWVKEHRYIDDFAEFILGDELDGRHFECELIYSDPPATPAAK